MYYKKKGTYPGRWLVKTVEAALIFGIIFFTFVALLQVFTPNATYNEVVVTTQSNVQVIRVRPQEVAPEPIYSDIDYFTMGYYHQVSYEYYEAITDYTRALEINPQLSSAWLNRGVAYEQLNNDYRAMHDFNAFFHRDGLEVITHRGILSGARLNVPMAEDRVYEINFYARAGQTVDISAVSVEPDLVDPLVLVVDANGQPVAANDDALRPDGSLISMDSNIRDFEVLRTGMYTLYVSHAGGGSYGDMRISLDTLR